MFVYLYCMSIFWHIYASFLCFLSIECIILIFLVKYVWELILEKQMTVFVNFRNKTVYNYTLCPYD